jgi:hypothetical protein
MQLQIMSESHPLHVLHAVWKHFTCLYLAAVEHNLLLLLLPGVCRDVLGVNPTTTTRSGSYADSVIKGYVKQLNAAVNGLVPAYQQLNAGQGSIASKGV